MLFVAVFASFISAAWFTWWLVHAGSTLASLDYPNERSLHVNPTPRGGGLGILLGMLVGIGIGLWSVPWDAHLWPILLAAAMVAAVSYLDDRRSVGVLPRLVTHLVAAVLVLALGGVIPNALPVPGLAMAVPVWVAAPLCVLALVWLTNLYNFMDGIDGLAGGMGLFGFGSLAVLAGGAAPALSVCALVLAAGCAGFLVFNYPPAQIFMGDVGASVLGFLGAAFILWGQVVGAFDWWSGVLAFSVFIADATVTLIRRALNRERVWRAHRSHFYQRLIAVGWSKTRTLKLGYVLMAATALAAVLSQGVGVMAQWGILMFVAGVLIAPMLMTTMLEGRFNKVGGRSAP